MCAMRLLEEIPTDPEQACWPSSSCSVVWQSKRQRPGPTSSGAARTPRRDACRAVWVTGGAALAARQQATSVATVAPSPAGKPVEHSTGVVVLHGLGDGTGDEKRNVALL